MAKDTFYFSHDYNARNDPKIKSLIKTHKFSGYGIYWAIIEDLYNNSNELPTDYKSIAFDLRTKEKLIKSIIEDFDLFIVKNNFFGSDSIQKRLEKRDLKSKKASESASKRWRNNANAYETQCDYDAIKDSIVKDIKESKGKDIIDNKFSFKNSLLEFSKNNQLIDDWISVRKTKKATNTKTAFDLFMSEVKISDIPIDEILKICIDKSWSGYKFNWILNIRKNEINGSNTNSGIGIIQSSTRKSVDDKRNEVIDLASQAFNRLANMSSENNQASNSV